MISTDQLKTGDLLFLNRNESDHGEAIGQVYSGADKQPFNHVALYIEPDEVIEAVAPCVQRRSLELSVCSVESFRPNILVCRLFSEWRHLIEEAVRSADGLVGMPYNHDYGSRKDSWYCSELIVDVFRMANNGQPVFKETPLNFCDPATGKILPYWQAYYAALGKDVPQGEPGSHPALLSQSDKLQPVGWLKQSMLTEK